MDQIQELQNQCKEIDTEIYKLFDKKKEVKREIKALKKQQKGWFGKRKEGFEKALLVKLQTKYGDENVLESQINKSLDQLEAALDLALAQGKTK